MFAAVAGLRAHQTKMDVIGNNVANVNTYGYKKMRAAFRDQFYATLKGSSEAGNVYGGGNPSQIGYGSQIGSIDVTFGTGSMAPTGNPLDLMINGNGFFLVGEKKDQGVALTSNATIDTNYDAATLTSLNLTRVGIFNIDGQGNVVDANGNYVYGFLGEDYTIFGGDRLEMLHVPMVYMSADGKKVLGTVEYQWNGNAVVPTDDAPNDYDEADGCYIAPMKLYNISVGRDGEITGVNDEEEVISIGKVAIANVPNPNALEATESGYYKAKKNTGVVTAEIPGEGSTGRLSSSVLEMANVDLAQEFTDMITTQRGFQANTRIITVTDEMLQELVNLKR